MTVPGTSCVEVLRSYDACQSLRRDWGRILSRQSREIDHLDLTSSFEWAMTLWQSHLHGRDQEVLVLRDGEEITGILPLYRFRKRVHGVPCRSVAPFTELYGGRAAFLLSEPRAQYLEALVEHVHKRLPSWDTLVVTVLEGSSYQQLLLDLARHKGWPSVVLAKERSPYIPLQETWERHFASLPKKLRSTMRNGEKRLRDRGELTYRECRSSDEVREFIAAVQAIELDSWKAVAGTAIASNPVHESFHCTLALRMAENGWFSGHLLLLDNQPVAYVMGLLHNGVFLDLKESYRASYREMSPGHVLKSFVFSRLYERGTRLYDFMGRCEEYKMKWTDKTYCRSTYLLFNQTCRGRAAFWLSHLTPTALGTGRTSCARLGTPEITVGPNSLENFAGPAAPK